MNINNLFIKEYRGILKKNERWLMNRILNYAKKHNFTKYISTLEESWRLSIKGISNSLIKEIKIWGNMIPEFGPDEKFDNDPVLEFVILEAQRQRKQGISLTMFIGLFKYYHQCYIDLFSISKVDDKIRNRYTLFTTRCFNRMEIAFINEWAATSSEKRIMELQDSNRLITNEKNKYLTIFESFVSPIILLDDEDKIVNFNLTASRLFTDVKIAGKIYYNEAESDANLKILNKKLKQLLNSSLEELSFETYLSVKDGKRFFLVKLKKMLDISGKFRGTIIMMDDLTNRKEIEKQLELAKCKAEEADKLKTAFLANMSHEIRTPMNAIIGFTDLLLNSDSGSDSNFEYLKLIQKSGADLLNIIEDIIDIAKIESKQMKIRITDCKPYELLIDLNKIYQEIILCRTGSEIKLIMTVEEKDKEVELFTDPERLKQVLSNLLNNAVKFTNEGFIEFGYTRVAGNKLYFYVKDTGIGIPDDKTDQIFNRFTRIEDSYTKNYGGTGLGLSISKNIISLLGGEIWVNSKINEGSNFYFYVPINKYYASQHKEKGKEYSNVNLNNLPDWSDFKILIAEDEETNFTYLNEILKRTGINILWAKNGLEAMNYAEKDEGINLILMDIKMPEVNGIEATKYILKILPEMPVIAQTAFAMDNDRELCLKIGCKEYLTKPINRNKLFSILKTFLKVKASVKL